ncbi:hypothetical protein K438DRAFT_806168 [Mycena galopus ATCC 62051]|nr:hypothetical protein K438DRAFT_806168 [Mycena galopus ATCC 62051]
MPSKSKLKSVWARCFFFRRETSPAPTALEPMATPSPLPMDRIDIHERPLAEQSLHAAQTTRRAPRSYDVALGGRWISMKAVSIPGEQGQPVVRSTCYEPVGGVEDIYVVDDMDSTAVEAKIPIALLLTCRQIYLEALPTLHQRNTFCSADDFAALFSALGRHCLPHIRYLNIYAPYDSEYRHGYSRDRTWRTVFSPVRGSRTHTQRRGRSGISMPLWILYGRTTSLGFGDCVVSVSP